VQKSVTELAIERVLLALKLCERRKYVTTLNTSVHLDSSVYPDHVSVWSGATTSLLMIHSKVVGLIAIKTHTNKNKKH